MKLLLNRDNFIIEIADDIVFGEYEGVQKWALFDEYGNVFLYVMDLGYRVEIYNGEIPEDIAEPSKYIYDNGTLVRNPDWVAPPPTIEKQVESLNEDIGDDWTANRIYYVGEYVMYKNKLWICKIQHESMAPAANSPYWKNVNIASEFNRLAAMINKED